MQHSAANTKQTKQKDKPGWNLAGTNGKEEIRQPSKWKLIILFEHATDCYH